MRTCFVLGCRTKDPRHRIPAEPEVYWQWLKIIGRYKEYLKEDPVNVKKKRLCRSHFRPEDLTWNGNLLRYRVPMLNLPDPLDIINHEASLCTSSMDEDTEVDNGAVGERPGKKRKFEECTSKSARTSGHRKIFTVNSKKPLPINSSPEKIKITNPISGKTTVFKVVKKVPCTQNKSNQSNKATTVISRSFSIKSNKTNIDPMEFLKNAGPPRSTLFKHHILAAEKYKEKQSAPTLGQTKIIKPRDKKGSPQREFKSKYDAFTVPFIKKKIDENKVLSQNVQPICSLNLSDSSDFFMKAEESSVEKKLRDSTNDKPKTLIVNNSSPLQSKQFNQNYSTHSPIFKGNNSNQPVLKPFKQECKEIPQSQTHKENSYLNTNTVLVTITKADNPSNNQLDLQKNTSGTKSKVNTDASERCGLEELLFESDMKIASEEMDSSFIFELLSPGHSAFPDPFASPHHPTTPDQPTYQNHTTLLGCSTTTSSPLYPDLLKTKDVEMNVEAKKEIFGNSDILSAGKWNTVESIILDEEIKNINLLVGCCGDLISKYLPDFLTMMMDKFSQRVHEFNLNVQVVATRKGGKMIKDTHIPVKVVEEGLQREEQDTPQCVQLAQWADMLLLLELDAHTLATISQGFCDDLLASVVRSWGMEKPAVYCPCMPSSMWQHPLTSRQLSTLDQWEFTRGPAIIDVTLPEEILAKLEETIQLIDSHIIVQDNIDIAMDMDPE